MWEEMGLVRVYTKPQGQQPDFSDPVVLSAVCLRVIIIENAFVNTNFFGAVFIVNYVPSPSSLTYIHDIFWFLMLGWQNSAAFLYFK